MKKECILLTAVIFSFYLVSQSFAQISFGEHTIVGGELSADGATSVFAIDIDGDNDIDMLSASETDEKIAWYENDGSQIFTEHTITSNTDGATSVFAVDLDGDNDIDVLSASAEDDKIAWYQNLTPVGIFNIDPTDSPIKFQLYNNFPNPFNPITTIRFTIPIVETGHAPSVQLRIYDVLGNVIAILLNEELGSSLSGSYEVVWDGANNKGILVPSGTYFYTLRAGDYFAARKMILLK